MPRTRRGMGSARAGIRVPGIYEDLLRRERERFAGRRTVFSVDPKDPGAGFFRRSTHRLGALEAGEPVTVSASQLVSRRVEVPEHMRPGRRAGARWWRVTPDDVVELASSPVVDRPTRKRRGDGVPG